jgi:hypothetical protein
LGHFNKNKWEITDCCLGHIWRVLSFIIYIYLLKNQEKTDESSCNMKQKGWRWMLTSVDINLTSRSKLQHFSPNHNKTAIL